VVFVCILFRLVVLIGEGFLFMSVVSVGSVG